MVLNVEKSLSLFHSCTQENIPKWFQNQIAFPSTTHALWFKKAATDYIKISIILADWLLAFFSYILDNPDSFLDDNSLLCHITASRSIDDKKGKHMEFLPFIYISKSIIIFNFILIYKHKVGASYFAISCWLYCSCLLIYFNPNITEAI